MSTRVPNVVTETSTSARVGRAALFCVGCALGALIAVAITLRLVQASQGIVIVGSDHELRFSIGMGDKNDVLLEMRDATGKAQRAEFDALPDGTIQFVLCDPKGARRLRLAVDGAGEPSLQFFDKGGAVISKTP
jgi:hypothetical protein